MMGKWPREQRVDACQIIEVIEVRVLEGKGTQGSIARQVRYLYEKGGTLLVRIDPCPDDEV